MSKQTLKAGFLPAKPGFFGKLPARGDFVSRRLPRAFIDPWENWLQEALANSQEQLGDSWLDNYLTSPLWRFVLSSGICGDGSWIGVLMPSVDSVGRYYPLTLASQLAPAGNPFVVMDQVDDWFDQVEGIALSALADDFSLEEFDQRLCDLPQLPCEPVASVDNPVESVMGSTRYNAWHCNLGAESSPTTLYSDLLQQLLKKLLFAYSLWRSQGSDRIIPSFLICQGLPHSQGFTALLDGTWRQHGWEELSSLLEESQLGQLPVGTDP